MKTRNSVQTMKTRLGPLETRLFAFTQLRALAIVRQGALTAALRITPKQESALLGRMARAGLMARVRPGVYLVPPRLPLGGAWSPDEALALGALMKEYGARYQVCGPSAFNRYGLDGQIPNRVYAYNDKISGERRVGTVSVTLIKVDPKRLGDTTSVRSTDGVETPYSSRVRTLVDAVYDWSRFDGLPRGYEWIRNDLESGRVKAAQLVACAVRYGDVATRRRIGALLEREGVSVRLLQKLERTLSTTQSTIPWIPTAKKRGQVDRRWGVVWNEGS
jgi:predicted transcriptional regulator of viral defense system